MINLYAMHYLTANTFIIHVVTHFAIVSVQMIFMFHYSIIRISLISIWEKLTKLKSNYFKKQFVLCHHFYLPPVDLYLISEKSIWKNQVRRTGFLVYFQLDFYCLYSLQKSISKLIFGG